MSQSPKKKGKFAKFWELISDKFCQSIGKFTKKEVKRSNSVSSTESEEHKAPLRLKLIECNQPTKH